MSKSERDNLAKLARQRARVSKSMVAERAKVLAADVEDQLSAVYRFDEDVWADVNRTAKEAVAQANAQILEACRQWGIPEQFAPSLVLQWYGRGESAMASRRSELRRLAAARIAESVASAKVAIDSAQLAVETELVRDGLTSARAHEFLAAMPTPEDVLPRVELGELDGTPQQRTRNWEPATGVVSGLLTPTTGAGREEQRARTTAALGGIERPALDSAEGVQR